jgi:hypothetical protein
VQLLRHRQGQQTRPSGTLPLLTLSRAFLLKPPHLARAQVFNRIVKMKDSREK